LLYTQDLFYSFNSFLSNCFLKLLIVCNKVLIFWLMPLWFVITWNECKWIRQYWIFKSEKTYLFRNISCLLDQLKKQARKLKRMSFLHTRYGNLIEFPVQKTSNKSWSLALSLSVLFISCHLSKASESLNSFGTWRAGRVSWRLANASSSVVLLM